MNTLKFNYSNPINDVFQANNQTIISNRYHYRSPYRSRFQYPPLISNLTNPNISPQLKSLINSSPTLKALSQSFLPSIPNNTEPIEETEKKSVLEPISEKKQSVTKKKTPKKEKLPKLQPIKEQKTNQQQNITPRKRNNIRFSNETTNVNQLNVNKSKTTISLPTIKATNSLKDKSSPRTQASTVRSINQSEKQSHQNQHQQNQQKHRRDSFTQRYVDEHEPRSTSSQNRNLESEMSERISSSKASCRSNNSKKMDLRFGSLLSEEGNYAMLKTYEDMIYQELLSLYPHLVTKQIQMYRTATQDFQMLPSKFFINIHLVKIRQYILISQISYSKVSAFQTTKQVAFDK